MYQAQMYPGLFQQQQQQQPFPQQQQGPGLVGSPLFEQMAGDERMRSFTRGWPPEMILGGTTPFGHATPQASLNDMYTNRTRVGYDYPLLGLGHGEYSPGPLDHPFDQRGYNPNLPVGYGGNYSPGGSGLQPTLGGGWPNQNFAGGANFGQFPGY